MSIPSVKCVKKLKCTHGGQTEGKLVRKMLVGGLTIKPVHLIGKSAQSMLGSIRNNGLAIMPPSLLTIKSKFNFFQ